MVRKNGKVKIKIKSSIKYASINIICFFKSNLKTGIIIQRSSFCKIVIKIKIYFWESVEVLDKLELERYINNSETKTVFWEWKYREVWLKNNRLLAQVGK